MALLSFSMCKIEFVVIPWIFIVQVLKIKLFEQKYRKVVIIAQKSLEKKEKISLLFTNDYFAFEVSI